MSLKNIIIILVCLLCCLLFVLGILLRPDINKPTKVDWYSFESAVLFRVDKEGNRTKVDLTKESLIIFPVQTIQDIEYFYPEYIIEGIFTLKSPIEYNFRTTSLPFILSDNPEVQGKIGNRQVIYISEK